jgi:ABC-type uncharacterized transport system involved in gliding motility auxiliary subunit
MKTLKNRPAWRAYTFIALIIALLACIATFLLAITRGLVATGTFTIANPENLTRWIYAGAGIVVLGIALYFILEPDKVRRFMTRRQARYGSNSLVMSLAFLGILIFANVLAFQNPIPIADLTEDKSNTLSKELQAALKQLPEKITATGFFSQSMNPDAATKLLENIKSNSNGKFDFQFIDPVRDPQTARNAGITGDGKILLQMGDHKEIAAFADESEILKALLRLLNPNEHIVYFLTGHGENSIDQAGDSAMTRAKATLESKNYVVKPLNLLVDNKIPADAGVIVIAGPVKPVSDAEVKLFNDYLGAGGSLIVMENPTLISDFGDAGDPLAQMLADKWGVQLSNDVVIDLNSTEPTYAISSTPYPGSHPITRGMNNIVTIYPFTRSLNVSDAIEGVTLTTLVQTNQNSWGEKDFVSLTQAGWPPSFDPNTESQGPLNLVAAGENTATKGRVVVFGTSNFATDQAFDAYGNGDMFVNTVDWSAEQENLANITPKTPTQRTFNLPGQFQWIAIVLSSVIIIPGLVVLSGISTWLTRRRQG